MITNSGLTIYHKTIKNHEEKWTRYNYENVWYFGGRGARINKGYDNANDVEIRIPYNKNNNLDINNFSIGDIIVKDILDLDITRQQDLKGYEIYNITSINNNYFGTQKHIHIGGK